MPGVPCLLSRPGLLGSPGRAGISAGVSLVFVGDIMIDDTPGGSIPPRDTHKIHEYQRVTRFGL
ncbi:MAG: hypothetical protein ABI656_09405 [bacterium]